MNLLLIIVIISYLSVVISLSSNASIHPKKEAVENLKDNFKIEKKQAVKNLKEIVKIEEKQVAVKNLKENFKIEVKQAVKNLKENLKIEEKQEKNQLVYNKKVAESDSSNSSDAQLSSISNTGSPTCYLNGNCELSTNNCYSGDCNGGICAEQLEKSPSKYNGFRTSYFICVKFPACDHQNADLQSNAVLNPQCNNKGLVCGFTDRGFEVYASALFGFTPVKWQPGKSKYHGECCKTPTSYITIYDNIDKKSWLYCTESIEGESCEYDAQCKSGICLNGKMCIDRYRKNNERCGKPLDIPVPKSWGCIPDESFDCKYTNMIDSFCESGLCYYGVCTEKFQDGAKCGRDEDCQSNHCYFYQCSPQLKDGSVCLLDSDCASKLCSFFTCAQKNNNDAFCLRDADCKSDLCFYSSCKEKFDSDSFCGRNEDCKSNLCSWFRCY